MNLYDSVCIVKEKLIGKLRRDFYYEVLYCGPLTDEVWMKFGFRTDTEDYINSEQWLVQGSELEEKWNGILKTLNIIEYPAKIKGIIKVKREYL
jgi:hypothetical protein